MLTSEISPKPLSTQQELDPHNLIVQLFREYAVDTGSLLPPLETVRWRELVFAILATYSQADLPESAVDHLVDILGSANLLDMATLSQLAPGDDAAFEHNPILVTLRTIIERSGLPKKDARAAIVTICEAAALIHLKYRDTVQLCVRKHAAMMLESILQEFSFTDAERAREFLAIWLQRTLNMPIPAATKATAEASADLGVSYDFLVQAADAANLHVGLLDDVLRAYMEDKAHLVAAEHAAQEDTP